MNAEYTVTVNLTVDGTYLPKFKVEAVDIDEAMVEGAEVIKEKYGCPPRGKVEDDGNEIENGVLYIVESMDEFERGTGVLYFDGTHIVTCINCD